MLNRPPINSTLLLFLLFLILGMVSHGVHVSLVEGVLDKVTIERSDCGK